MEKLSSYKLDYVANHWLGKGKNPVEPQDIFRAYADVTDRMIAEQNIGNVTSFLQELRVVRAFEFVTRYFSSVILIACSK